MEESFCACSFFYIYILLISAFIYMRGIAFCEAGVGLSVNHDDCKKPPVRFVTVQYSFGPLFQVRVRERRSGFAGYAHRSLGEQNRTEYVIPCSIEEQEKAQYPEEQHSPQTNKQKKKTDGRTNIHQVQYPSRQKYIHTLLFSGRMMCPPRPKYRTSVLLLIR